MFMVVLMLVIVHEGSWRRHRRAFHREENDRGDDGRPDRQKERFLHGA
jgi:hypothetical protein